MTKKARTSYKIHIVMCNKLFFKKKKLQFDAPVDDDADEKWLMLAPLRIPERALPLSSIQGATQIKKNKNSNISDSNSNTNAISKCIRV